MRPSTGLARAWRSMPGGPKGRQQHNPRLPQEGFELGQPGVTVAQQQPGRAWRQVQGGFALMDVGWYQFYPSDDARPADTGVQAEAVQGLADDGILAIAGLPAEAPTAMGACKLANREREAVDDADSGIRGPEGITDGTPEPFLHLPQIGR